MNGQWIFLLLDNTAAMKGKKPEILAQRPFLFWHRISPSYQESIANMIKHTILLIYRNFKRFRTTFFINLIGLSTGLACSILIYLWVNDELGVDKFHENDHRLFQVMTNQNRPDDIVTLGHGPGQLVDELPVEMPEVEYAVGTSRITEFTLSIPGKNLTASGQFASEHFFEVFSFPLLQGDDGRVLNNKNAIVLSEKTAQALFNTTENVVGKTVEWAFRGFDHSVVVTGVFRDIGVNSSQQFDFLLSYEMYKELLGESLHWGNHNAMTFLLLRENTNVAEFNSKIENFIKNRNADTNLTIFAAPYSDNYLYGKYENGKSVGGRIGYVRLFAAIGIFILIIACINFMNLATAKASRRIKEVGIKKAVGAGRKILIIQYLAESLMMAFLSVAVALLLVDVFLPQFNAITGKQLFIPFNGAFISVVFGIAVITGLVSGSYPALYLSRFSPALVLKGRLTSLGGEQWARSALVVFQFTLSIMFIVAVWITYKQMAYVETKYLGLEKDDVIYFKMQGTLADRYDTFVAELKEIPGVVEASGMWGNVTGLTSFTTGSFDWKGRDPDKVIQFEHLGVHYNLIELLDIQIVSGRSFSEQFPTDTTAIILNETAVRVMGLTDAVGERFGLWGNDYKIIGVVKDFHFESLRNEVKPFFFRVRPREIDKVLVKLEEGNEQSTIQRIEAFHKRFNPGYAFDYRFLDEDYQAQYSAEQRMTVLSKYFAGLAILISCLGLFGLAAFTAERRLKEIGIRRVHGSSVAGIVYLLCNDFNKIVVIAIVLAMPISFFGTTIWLESFAYRIEVEWWYFFGAGCIALVISWITVGIQAWKVASINPIKCLKDE